MDVVDGGRHNQKVNVSNTCGCVIRSKPRLGNGKNPAQTLRVSHESHISLKGFHICSVIPSFLTSTSFNTILGELIIHDLAKLCLCGGLVFAAVQHGL